jgi:hypothetical protein
MKYEEKVKKKTQKEGRAQEQLISGFLERFRR